MNEASLVRNNTTHRCTPFIVGVGASAGGLEAFQELLANLDDALVPAIVFVQHRNKENDELLVELLRKSTQRSVVSILGRTKLCAGTIYVCPPWTLLELKNGVARPTASENHERPRAPIDHFLQSLAADQGKLGVGVILSGNGSDGTIGLKAISDAGGMTIAQSEDSAKYDSMPRSAATTGVADHVLTPKEIAEELKRYFGSLSGMSHSPRDRVSDQQIYESIPAIAKLLVEVTNHNFQHYKPNMLVRRISRRMQVLKISKIETYLALLKQNPDEPQKLFRELLISVTAFFRDPEAFEVLSQAVIQELFENRRSENVIRIWVPGCATGEEAFTMAILCREAMDRLSSPPEVQIFATDIDERALAIGRAGAYPVGIEEDVSAERLQRFFVKRGKKYQIVKEVRELVLFSVHNLISDPPFSHQDLISCRNLLIYLGGHLQKKLIPLFHYALRPSGFLLLGPSEDIASHGDLFRTMDARHRIARRNETGLDAKAALLLDERRVEALVREVRRPLNPTSDTTEALLQVMQRIVLDEFAPKSLIVEEDGKILCASADMHHYLTVGSGGFQNNVIKMARTGLRVGLRAALQEAKSQRRRVVHDNLSVRINGQLQRVMLTVQPMPKVGEDVELFMVVFHDCGLPLVRDNSSKLVSDVDWPESMGHAVHGTDAIIAHLEQELTSTREDLERSIQAYETTNEELKASNEELRSLNEEMQSANEELETSKEEIQTGIALLGKAHSDLENLFQSTQIATLFLDANERLIRFTPAARDLYNLIASDVGRPLGDITHKVVFMPAIPKLSELALDDNSPELEVLTLKGRWFLRRVLPYFHEGRADGVIVTFIDISERKRAVIRLATTHEVARILAADPAMDSIFPAVLESIRKSLNAACCLIWLVDSEGNSLKCAESSFDLSHPSLEQFVVESQRLSLKRGAGLPGCVWETSKTSWIAELASDSYFLRKTHSSAAGLVSGIAMPIIIGTVVYGVVEIFTNVYLEQDQALLEMLQTVGYDIGQFIARKQLAEKLRDEESRKSAILEAAIDAIITMDMEGRIVDFNPAAERTFGFAKSDVQGQLLSETIIPHEFREAHSLGLARYMATGIGTVLGRRLELSAVRKDGSVFPVELAISATATRDGTRFFTGHLRDITEQKQFVQTILDRDDRITALLNSTAEGIYGIDLEGRCTFANASCARLLGFEDSDALVGRQMHELIHHTRPNGQPYPVDECKIYRASRLSESVHADDELYWRADGTSFDVEYWSFPQIHQGMVVGCVVSFLDISERKRWASELADRESNLRRVIDNTLGFVGVLDLQGVLREVNQTALVAGGLTREDVIGKRFWECYWWSHDEQLVKKLQASIAAALSGEVVRYDVEVRMAGESRLAIDFMLAPVKDADGNVTCLIPSGIDISERKRAELEVQERINQLNLALDSGRMGLWEWDIVADHVTWSSHLYDAFGFTETTFHPTRAGFFAIIHPDDRQRLELLIHSAFKSSCLNHEVEFRVIRCDNGKMVWAHSRGTIRRNSNGEPTAILSVSVDITERKRRELTLSFLADLHTSLALLSSAEAIVAKASQSMAEYLQLSHLMVITMDEHATQASVEFDYCSDGSRSLLGVYHMADFASDDERRLLAAGLPMVIDDTAASNRSVESTRNFSALNVGSLLNAPSSRDQRLRFLLCATKEQPHVWREDEIDLMRELANILRLKLDRASAEAALKESEARFRDLADNISQFAWMTDATGSIFWYNQRWFDYTGTTLDQMKDWGWEAVQHPLHLRRVVDRWRESLASGKVWEDTFPLRSKDGEYRWFLSRAQPIRDEAGSIVRWFGTNTDITETRQAEEQLAGSRERLTMAMTSARMGSYEWEPASDRALWDEQHLAITGLQLTEMRGSDFLKLIHPEDVESNRLAMERTINGECDYDTEFRIIRADGQVRWLAARGKLVAATDDRPLRFVGMNWDITEQKKIDEVVRRGEARLQRIIDGASVGVAFAKTSGEVTRANDATLRILGIARSDFECHGFNWTSLVRVQQRPDADRIIQQLVLTGRMDPCEMTIVRDDNTPTPVLISSLSVDFESAEHVVFLVDLTQQKMYEQSLHEARLLAEAANQSKSEFVANMSHEIRTPMTAVLGFADLLTADEDNPQKLLYLQTIKRNGSFLLDIINDILDLSKIEAGKMEILKERFPVQTVIEDVRTMMAIRATEKGLNFVVEYQEKIPAEIESDPKRLRQILVNLIGNAIKFTESGNVKLVVRFLENDGGQIHFDVTDTGIGISAQQQQRLFQPFSQGDASVTRSFGGSGLGLSISRRLARFLGGDIVLRSEPGTGSTFSFAIAVGDVSGVQRIDATASVQREEKAHVTEYRLNCHVLIVDDRRDVRFLSRRILTNAGATITEAEDGLEAIEFVNGSAQSRTEFDLVLLDMQMPRMDGYQTAIILRQTGFSRPIIALTADAMHGDMKHCLECGCDDYLSKPIDSLALLEMVFKHTQIPPSGV